VTRSLRAIGSQRRARAVFTERPERMLFTPTPGPCSLFSHYSAMRVFNTVVRNTWFEAFLGTCADRK
jgi:hypothetical protein